MVKFSFDRKIIFQVDDHGYIPGVYVSDPGQMVSTIGHGANSTVLWP